MLIDKKIVHWASAVATLLVFSAALWVLHRSLQGVQFGDVLTQFRGLPWLHVLFALGLTAASYLLLTGYDVLGLRYIGKPLSYSKTALASFIAYAFSHNIGLALVTGGSVRYRIYSAAGLSIVEIATITGLCAVTFGMGTVIVVALVMVLEPQEATALLHLPSAAVSGTGRNLGCRRGISLLDGAEALHTSNRRLVVQITVVSHDRVAVSARACGYRARRFGILRAVTAKRRGLVYRVSWRVRACHGRGNRQPCARRNWRF